MTIQSQPAETKIGLVVVCIVRAEFNQTFCFISPWKAPAKAATFSFNYAFIRYYFGCIINNTTFRIDIITSVIFTILALLICKKLIVFRSLTAIMLYFFLRMSVLWMLENWFNTLI